MSNYIRNFAQPVLPVAVDEYSPLMQNVTNFAVMQFGVRSANAINQLLRISVPQSADYSEEFTFPASGGGIYRVNLEGDINLNPPKSGSDGDIVTLWLYAGGAGSKTVTLNSSIVVPSTITGSTPLTIALGKKAVYTIRYDQVLNKGQWELVSFQNGY